MISPGLHLISGKKQSWNIATCFLASVCDSVRTKESDCHLDVLDLAREPSPHQIDRTWSQLAVLRILCLPPGLNKPVDENARPLGTRTHTPKEMRNRSVTLTVSGCRSPSVSCGLLIDCEWVNLINNKWGRILTFKYMTYGKNTPHWFLFSRVLTLMCTGECVSALSRTGSKEKPLPLGKHPAFFPRDGGHAWRSFAFRLAG